MPAGALSRMKVLVTGGRGFIGSHLMLKLEHPTSFDIEDGMDINDRHQVAIAVRGMNAVVHLAAVTNVSWSVHNPERTRRVNVEGTKTVLKESVSAGVRKFIFASSCAVYGDAKTFPTSEGAPLRPTSPYARSKVLAERACGAYSHRFLWGCTVLRFFNVYGPGHKGVMDAFGRAIMEGRRPLIFGDGSQTRDFVHVSDVVEAIVLALGQKAGGTFNIGSGRETTIKSLLEPEFRPRRQGDIMRSAADIRKARDILGFSPAISSKPERTEGGTQDESSNSGL
jgi:UDP-glucose 4-epimerase